MSLETVEARWTRLSLAADGSDEQGCRSVSHILDRLSNLRERGDGVSDLFVGRRMREVEADVRLNLRGSVLHDDQVLEKIGELHRIPLLVLPELLLPDENVLDEPVA